MRVVKQWVDWELFCQEAGRYLLVRYDRRNQIKTLQISLSAANDATAVDDSEEQMKAFEKKELGPAAHINRLR